MQSIKRLLCMSGIPHKQLDPPLPSPYEKINSTTSPFPAWYREDEDLADIMTPQIQEMLSERTGLDGLKLEAHILDVRRKAWSQGQFPAIGGFRFLRPTIMKHPYFSEMCSKLKDGATLLELGSGLGQDLEYLIEQGAPSDRMYAVDNRPQLWELGRQLFGRDKGNDRRGPHFIPANITRSGWVKDFVEEFGQVDIILANQFFDNMDDVYILEIMRWIRPLLKPGTIIVGYQTGAEEPFEENGIMHHNRVTWWGNWQARTSEHGQPDIGLEVDLYETVSLTEWGLQPREWAWIGQEGIHGVYFVTRRSK